MYVTSTSNQAFVAQGTTGNVARFCLAIDGGLWFTQIGSVNINVGTPTTNTWNYLAVTFNGTTLTLYVNGTSIGTATTVISAQNTTLAIGTLGASWATTGEFVTGYISNVRVSSVVRTITTPTAPFTSDANTKLLACQSNRFIDSSSNAYVLNLSAGSPSVQRFSPFSPTTAYSTSVIGGSGYFDGSGDYLTTPSTGQFAPSGDFTVSLWYYPTNLANYYSVLGNYTTTTTTDWLIETWADGTIKFYTNGGTPRISSASGAIVKNQWNFISMSRSGSTITAYVNGVSQGTYSQTGTFGTTSKSINIAGAVAQYTSGYIADVKLIDGSAITTIPTAPQTATSGTNLLLSYTNAGILDNAEMNDLETVGNAQISTSVKKYGTGSMYFDGTGDYLTRPASDLFAFGTGDFTIEFWAYKTANTSGSYDVAFGTGDVGTGNNGYFIELSSTRGFVFASGNAVVLSYAMNPNTSSWKFYTITRSGTTLRLFVDGTVVASTTYSTSLTSTVSVRVGGTAGDFFGYIDDLRITKGYARYTSNFTAPTAAFADKG